MSKFAQVKDGIVQNVIVLNEYNEAFLSGFDSLINVDDKFVGPGFTYDGNDFMPPVETEEANNDGQ